MTTKRARMLALALGAGVALSLAPAAPAAAAPRADAPTAPTPSAWAGADYVSVGRMSPQFYVQSDLLGWLLKPIVNPVLTGFVNPAMKVLGNLPRQAVETLANLVNNAGLTANNPAASEGMPDTAACKDAAPKSCYAMAAFGSQPWGPRTPNHTFDFGFAQTSGATFLNTDPADSTVMARAQTSGFGINLFDIPIVSVGNATATAQCPTVLGKVPTSTSTQNNVQLFGGLISMVQADSESGWQDLRVGDYPLIDTPSINVGDFAGSPLHLRFAGTGVAIQVGLDPYSFLDGVGLGALTGFLKSFAPAAKVMLNVFAGPGDHIADEYTASAWGNNFGFDLDIDLSLNLGLAKVGFKVPSDMTADGVGGNLLALKISYASCGTGEKTAAAAVPPGVN